jgi:hypothetical protein
MDASYFRTLAARCLSASRNCFELRAKEEFRQLANEFLQKADEVERVDLPIAMTTRGAGEREGGRE